jgi:hypothetical protein
VFEVAGADARAAISSKRKAVSGGGVPTEYKDDTEAEPANHTKWARINGRKDTQDGAKKDGVFFAERLAQKTRVFSRKNAQKDFTLRRKSSARL